MGTAGAAHAARARVAGAHRFGSVGTGAGGREHGQFLFEAGRAAMRAVGSLPVGGTDEEFAVVSAFPAMKLVDWHGPSLPGCEPNAIGRWVSGARCAVVSGRWSEGGPQHCPQISGYSKLLPRLAWMP
jgi:hypothetical protein